MTENKRLEFREIEHEWGTTHYFTYNGIRIQESEVAEMFNEMYNENQQLKAQLHCDDVCSICKHEYLVEDRDMKGYYVAKCEKEHIECSKEDVKYCEDFELVRDYDD